MDRVEVMLLGSAQDAGLPQVGCACRFCAEAREDPPLRRRPVSLGIADRTAGKFWIIDATQAFPEQLDDMAAAFPDCVFSGIFLTHAHMGHYTGLVHLGNEAWNRQGVPLFASRQMLSFLESNLPWSDLLANHLVPEILETGDQVVLSGALAVRPERVPHRAEYTDTFAYWVEASRSRLFYCPDIDGWTNYPIQKAVRKVDHALLDGTFYSPGELPGRNISQIPHPFVTDTLAQVQGAAAQIWFIHLNHTNPLNRPGPEREAVLATGARVAEEGQRWELD